MKIGIQFSFDHESVDGRFYIRLFEKFVKFEKYGFGKGYKSYPWKDSFVKDIINADNKTRIAIYSNNSDILSAGVAATSKQNEFQSIGVSQEQILFPPINDIQIEEFVSYKGFVSAYLYNEDYESVQFESFHNNIKHRNIQQEIWNTVKNTPFKIMEHGREYDTRFNPGRKILISYTWIMAAWKMWFGDGFFHVVTKERLLAFPHAVELKELENGIVYVQLYEKIEEPYTPDSMFRQTKWLEWIKIDELEEKFK